MKNHHTLAILTITLLIIIPYGTAQLSLCPSETPDINKNCTMLTPALNCTTAGYTYDIYNATNNPVVTDGTLHPYNSDIYQFNFTLVDTKGDYLIQLCDGSTRMVRVGGGDIGKMSLAAIILLPIAFAALLIYIGNSLNEEEHLFLKVVFSLFAMLSVLFSIWFSFITQDQILGSSPFEDAIATFLWIVIILVFAVFAYMFLYLTVKFLKMAAEHKDAQLKY